MYCSNCGKELKTTISVGINRVTSVCCLCGSEVMELGYLLSTSEYTILRNMIRERQADMIQKGIIKPAVKKGCY